ncbi:MAG: preprotein translocase subunit SecE [Patescibacteria group bacterium]
MFNSIKNYFVGAWAEMKKVSWPTKKQTFNYSVLVIGISLSLALIFSVTDYVLNAGITTLLAR